MEESGVEISFIFESGKILKKVSLVEKGLLWKVA